MAREVSHAVISTEMCKTTGKPHKRWLGYTGDTVPQHCENCDTYSNEFPPPDDCDGRFAGCPGVGHK